MVKKVGIYDRIAFIERVILNEETDHICGHSILPGYHRR